MRGVSLSVQMALIVAQCREGGRLSGIKLSALSSGLQRVARLAHRKKGLQCSIQSYLIFPVSYLELRPAIPVACPWNTHTHDCPRTAEED